MNLKPFSPIYFGLLAFIVSAIVVTFASKIIGTSALLYIVIAPVAEESIKAWVSKRFPLCTAFKTGAYSGLSFGLIEASVYSISGGVTAFILRLVSTVPMHTITFGLDAEAVNYRRYGLLIIAVAIHAAFNGLAYLL